MRKIVTLTAVFVAIMMVVPCFAVLPPVTDGLVGCWDFDEGSGVTAIDSSGIGNHGLIVNATYTGDDIPPQSQSGYSLIFNNTQSGNAYSYVTVPDNSSLRPSSGLTLAAWIKTDITEQRSCVIISKQYGSSYRDSFALLYGGGSVSFVLDSGADYRGISTAKPSVDEWHYIVGTYNGSSMRLYVDGVERVHDTFTGAIAYDDNPVLIGAACDNANHTPDAGWNGTIDDVMIYNRSLTQAEILQIIPEFPSVLMLPLFMSATIIGVIAYTWRRRKQANSPFLEVV